MIVVIKEQIKPLQAKLESAFKVKDLLDFYKRINEEYSAIMNNLLTETCFIFYEHPVLDYKNKIYKSTKLEVIAFLKEQIAPQMGEGLDVIVTDSLFVHFFIFNHGGDVFYFTPCDSALSDV